MLGEQFFGRGETLWAVTERQFKWVHDKYDNVVRLCRVLTNFHIINYPLNIRDESSYCSYHDRLYSKGVLVGKKQKDNQKVYSDRQKQRLNDNWECFEATIVRAQDEGGEY